jgi:hypothetical protein
MDKRLDYCKNHIFTTIGKKCISAFWCIFLLTPEQFLFFCGGGVGQSRDLLIIIYFIFTLPLSHSGCPARRNFVWNERKKTNLFAMIYYAILLYNSWCCKNPEIFWQENPFSSHARPIPDTNKMVIGFFPRTQIKCLLFFPARTNTCFSA